MGIKNVHITYRYLKGLLILKSFTVLWNDFWATIGLQIHIVLLFKCEVRGNLYRNKNTESLSGVCLNL